MSFADWLRSSHHDIQTHGLGRGSALAAQEFATGIGRRLGEHANYGTPMWERDWDVLILLDACRHDLMKEVASDYHFLPDTVDSVYSPASMSEEWLERHTQARYTEEMAQTSLVSANAFTRSDCVRESDWATLDEVWKHSWSDPEGTVLPRPVTESAIRHWRQRDEHGANQMIVWYLQPHGPFIDADWSDGFEKSKIGDGAGMHKSIWRRFRDGEITRERLWEAYRRNLNYVLDDVEVLLKNLDADDVVISSDHANCLGEWGVYGHPKYVPAPSLKRVPWVETTATDKRTVTPDETNQENDVTTEEVDDRLEALGYA